MIRITRENRNPRDLEIKVGDLIRPVGVGIKIHVGIVAEIGEPATCPDYVIAVFPHWGETVVYADEWEVIND